MVDDSAGDAPLDLLTAGRLVGGVVWAESRLFEVLGGWVEGTPEPEMKAFWATTSRHHGWQAEQLATLLPLVAGGPTRAELESRPFGPLGDALEGLASLSGATVDRRAAWLVAVDRLAASIDEVLAHTTPVADGAFRRVAAIVLGDIGADRDRLEAIGEPSPSAG